MVTGPWLRSSSRCNTSRAGPDTRGEEPDGGFRDTEDEMSSRTRIYHQISTWTVGWFVLAGVLCLTVMLTVALVVPGLPR